MSDTIRNIPTNIITGFLGVGKTTAILSLLKTKPEGERWAVLVNEFGEVGIDGSLFEGQSEDSDELFIREVPGGCMCCASGLPMQIALNQLLVRAKPDRLLIEPTGLGHPKEVLEVLQGDQYQGVLDIQATIALVDARKISDSRYRGHPVFNQQIDIADVIVANKSDLYQEGDFSGLQHFLIEKNWLGPCAEVEQGRLDPTWLNSQKLDRTEHPSCCGSDHSHKHKHKHSHEHGHEHSDEHNYEGSHEHSQDGSHDQAFEFPEQGYITIKNEGEGFVSQGWIFKPSITFSREKLYELMIATDVERIKGVFIVEDDVLGYNKADGQLTEQPLDDCTDSRVELIVEKGADLNVYEEKLLSCIVSQA